VSLNICQQSCCCSVCTCTGLVAGGDVKAVKVCLYYEYVSFVHRVCADFRLNCLHVHIGAGAPARKYTLVFTHALSHTHDNLTQTHVSLTHNKTARLAGPEAVAGCYTASKQTHMDWQTAYKGAKANRLIHTMTETYHNRTHTTCSSYAGFAGHTGGGRPSHSSVT